VEVADTSYQIVGTGGGIVGTPGRQDFIYDANGNLLSIQATRMEIGGRENLVNTRNLLFSKRVFQQLRHRLPYRLYCNVHWANTVKPT
jgi:hypothetical protein